MEEATRKVSLGFDAAAVKCMHVLGGDDHETFVDQWPDAATQTKKPHADETRACGSIERV